MKFPSLIHLILCFISWTFSLQATQVNIPEDIEEGLHVLKGSPSFKYYVSMENAQKVIEFNKILSLENDVSIKSAWPLEFNSEFKCRNLSITYAGQPHKVHNNGVLECTGLHLYHSQTPIYFVNKGTCRWIHHSDEPNESKRMNLEGFILLNEPYGRILIESSIEFYWGKEESPTPKRSPAAKKRSSGQGLVYGIESSGGVARIQNYGVIKGSQDMALDVPTYIHEGGIISTKRDRKIRFSKKEPCPVYSIIRIPEKFLLSYGKGDFSAGQLGEKTAAYYYTQFEKIPEEKIVSFKENNSDHGIDLLCATSPKAIVHECKNLGSSTFKLSPSKSKGKQCSKKWIESYFLAMAKNVKEDSKEIPEDSVLKIFQEKDHKDKEVYRSILKITLSNPEEVSLKETLSENHLLLNGNSISHVETRIGPLPLYYCQRNIDAAFND